MSECQIITISDDKLSCEATAILLRRNLLLRLNHWRKNAIFVFMTIFVTS